jgi:Membrane proteins related to metalloendopeptidases
MLASTQSALGPNIVVDGNFETPDVTSASWDTYYAGQFLDSWFVEVGSVDHKHKNAWQSADGRQSVDLSGDSSGAISQYLLTAPLQSYMLSFALAGNPGSLECSYAGPIKQMEVWWGSTRLDILSFDTTGHSPLSMGWSYHQYIVTATDAVTKLMFKSLYPYCHGPVLDMVSVQSYSGGEIPIFDLPLDHTDKNFADIALGSFFGGWVNTWFDHNTPDYNKNQKLRLWNGKELTSSDMIDVSNCSTFPGRFGLSCYDGHNGIDFQRQSHKENGVVIYDDTIYAAAPGRVVALCNTYPCTRPSGEITSDPSYGRWVLIQHGEGGIYGKYATFYAHLSEINPDLVVGKEITDPKKVYIGKMGGATSCTRTVDNKPVRYNCVGGIHLHFGVYYDANGNNKWEDKYQGYTEAIDPYGWFGITADPWWNKSLYLWKYPLQDQKIVDQNGAELTTPSGKGKVKFEPGIFVAPITVELWDSLMPKAVSSDLRGIGHPVWLRVLEWLTGSISNFPSASTSISTTSTGFPQPATINIQYDTEEVEHLILNQMSIYKLDETTDSWIRLPTNLDFNMNEATAQIDDMGYFSLQAPLICPADTQEPNDTLSKSNIVPTDGTLINNRFDIVQDEDWFQFEAVAGNTYQIRTAHLAAGADTILELYDSDGVTLLASNDNDSGYASLLNWQVPRDGIYFVRVTRALASTYGCSSAYDIEVILTAESLCYPINTSVSPLNSGSVWVNQITDGLINPPPMCQDDNQYPFGAVIRLTASPEPGYAFNNWIGDISGNTNPVEITMLSDQVVTANFTQIQTFGDVPPNYWAWNYIERLYVAGITGGCALNPLKYCPETMVTRAQMAVFLLRSKYGSSYAPPAVGGNTGFGDVQPAYWAGAWIKQLASEGITGGCGSGIYCPESAVTRAQMAVFLLRSKYGASYSPPAVGGSTGFNDVSPTHWAGAWIKQLVAEGITAGCGTGMYCPEASVTRAQMAVFLVRTFNLP